MLPLHTHISATGCEVHGWVLDKQVKNDSSAIKTHEGDNENDPAVHIDTGSYHCFIQVLHILISTSSSGSLLRHWLSAPF